MQIFNINRKLFSLDGEPLIETLFNDAGVPDGKKELSMADVMVISLMSATEKDKDLSGDKKLGRYMLAIKIKAAQKGDGLVTLETDDISLIKKLIGERSTTIVVGQVYPFLENEGEKAS